MSSFIPIDSLNPEQREAVLHRDGPLLLLAGAGSGKTRVATFRIGYLIQTGVSPSQILAVTFTNKAAAEMAERLAALIGHDAAKQATVSTFHKLGVGVLREQGHRVGVPKDFAIVDASDQLALVSEAMRAARVDQTRYEPRWMLSRISAAKNEGKRPGDLGHKITDILGQLVAEVYANYEAALQALRSVDFDDLILRPLELFRNHAAALQWAQTRWRYILVDEFQDTNHVQFELVRLLGGSSRNVFCVGDDDQSIYGWRGARVENVYDFERSFPGARVLALTQNYRSTGNILEAANAVIRRNAVRRDKRMWTADAEGATLRFVRHHDPEAEAEAIARFIRDATREGAELRRPHSDFGILFRTNSQAKPLETALREAGVAYHLVGAMSFFDRKEVRDALAHIRILAQSADEISLRRAIAFPGVGLGAASLGRLRAHADARRCTLYQALRDVAAVSGVPARVVKTTLEWVGAAERARAELEKGKMLIAPVERYFADIRFKEALSVDATPEQSHARWRNLTTLFRMLAAYESKTGADATLGDFLRGLSLELKDDEAPETDVVRVMTLHAAKGLEFPVVFLVGVEEGILPHQRSIDAGNVDEERRLFYVGVTRARQQLVITACAKRTLHRDTRRCTLSRFVDELPPELLVREDQTSDEGSKDAELRKAALARIAKIFGD